MKTLVLGTPPIETVMHLPEGSPPIPSPSREIIRASFEAQSPSVYMLAAFDPPSQLFAVVTSSREVWLRGKTIREIILAPTLPAKGWGFIELGMATKEDATIHWMISAPTYSEAAHAWLRSKAQDLANMLNCTVREQPPLHDV